MAYASEHYLQDLSTPLPKPCHLVLHRSSSSKRVGADLRIVLQVSESQEGPAARRWLVAGGNAECRLLDGLGGVVLAPVLDLAGPGLGGGTHWQGWLGEKCISSRGGA